MACPHHILWGQWSYLMMITRKKKIKAEVHHKKSKVKIKIWDNADWGAEEAVSTFYEEGLLVVNVHEAVGAGVAIASERVPDQLLPGGLGDWDVVVLHPAPLVGVVDVGPVVSSIGLALMHQHRMQPVRNLGDSRRQWVTIRSEHWSWKNVSVLKSR